MGELKIGKIIKCEVSGITDYGVFVKIDDNYTGMIHISEVSNRFVSNLERLYTIGDTLSAKIIDIDEEKKQVKLSIKENKLLRKRKKGIEEKGEGFKPLKENLDNWVQEKLNELRKK